MSNRDVPHDLKPRKGYRMVTRGKVRKGDLTFYLPSRDLWDKVRPDEVGMDIKESGWIVCRRGK